MTKDYINTITSLTMTLKRVKINLEARLKVVYWRVVGRSENRGGGVSSNVVDIIFPLVEIGLTNLPKLGGAPGYAPPPDPLIPTTLH